MVFPPRPPDSLILVSRPCPEGHFPAFFAIQAYLSRTFHLAIDSLGRRRNGPSSEIVNQAQGFSEQARLRVLAVLARVRVNEFIADHQGQAKGIIEFAVGQQSGVGRNSRRLAQLLFIQKAFPPCSA